MKRSSSVASSSSAFGSSGFDVPGAKKSALGSGSFSEDMIAARSATGRDLFQLLSASEYSEAEPSKIEGLQTQEVVVPPKLVEYVMTAEHRQLITEETGAEVEWFPEKGRAMFTGVDYQIKQAARLITRVETHCHWGVNEEKVTRLLKRPPVIESVLVKLSPMTEHLRAAEKRLGGQATHMSIGKDKQCDVVLKNPIVSRAHCQISLDSAKGSVYISDLSTNGTYLNGHRLPAKKLGSVLLSHGDEILLSDPSGGDGEFGYMVNLQVISEKKEVKLDAPRQILEKEWASNRRFNPCGVL